MANNIQYVPVDKLVLDTENPRFANLYSGKSEADIIKYLLEEENAKEIVNNIIKHGEFFQDEILWVIKQPNGGFLVKEGNRRTAAVKALASPEMFGIQNSGLIIEKMPVIVFDDLTKLDVRIREKHATPSFRAWSRIAKALEIYRLYVSHASDAEIKAVDSKVSDFLKIANFYNAAVKIKGDSFKELVRSGGEKGNKLTIFERLFAFSEDCGYTFKSKSYGYAIQIVNSELFKKYIELIVDYLQENPETTYYEVNKQEDKRAFLDKIGLLNDAKKNQQLGLIFNTGVSTKDNESIHSNTKADAQSDTVYKKNEDKKSVRGSVKRKPELKRKGRQKQLDAKIDELFLGLKSKDTPNARMAMVRIVFECCLKWVLEETRYNGKRLRDYDYFKSAFITTKGDARPFTDFTRLSSLFTVLITNTSIRNAFKTFKPDDLHQVIHNYNVSAVSRDCDTMVDNLLPLIEFLLQDENDFITQIDTKKLV